MLTLSSEQGTESDDGSSSSEDDIEEEDEDEIEEDLDVLNDSLDVGRRDSGEKMKIEPGDMIVLDFASHMKRMEKILSENIVSLISKNTSVTEFFSFSNVSLSLVH